MRIYRGIGKILCSCGGEPEKVETTETEIDKHGCDRDKPDWSCCVMAIQCPSCKTRWTLDLESPEADQDRDMDIIDPFTGQPIGEGKQEQDPLQEYYQVHNAITRLQLQMIALRNYLIINVIPRLAIGREEMEIDVIAKELLNWDQP